MQTVAEFLQQVVQCETGIEELRNDARGATIEAAVEHAVKAFTAAICEGRHEIASSLAAEILATMQRDSMKLEPRHDRLRADVNDLADAIRRCIEEKQKLNTLDELQSGSKAPAVPKARRKGLPKSVEQIDYGRLRTSQNTAEESSGGDLPNNLHTNNCEINDLYKLKHRLADASYWLKGIQTGKIPRRRQALARPTIERLYEQLGKMQSNLNAKKFALDDAIAMRPRQHWRDAMTVADHAKLECDQLDCKDIALATNWATSMKTTRNEKYALESAISARKAERALLKKYRDLYGPSEVEDLSITQLSGDRDRRWRSADIRVPGGLIDVKNARSAWESPKRYSEWFVKDVNKRSAGGEVVTLSAVLSPYSKLSCSLEDVNKVIWLGELSASRLEELKARFSREYLHLDFELGDEAGRKGSRLPGWLFDYPMGVYKTRDRHRTRWREYQAAACSGESWIPPVSALDGPDMEREREAFSSRFDQTETIDRPALFLHILDRFCIAAREEWEFPKEQLRYLLWPPVVCKRIKDWQKVPYAIADPGEYVVELLEVLMKISQTCQEQALQFSGFRLCGRNIFRGRESVGSTWKTLFAYCGGWNDEQKKCGKDPLYAGRHLWCDECGKLVCDKCGHCERGCEQMVTRKRRARCD